VSDFVLITKVGYLSAGEVCPVVRDDGVGAPEVTHGVLPKEFDNLLSSDLVKLRCLD